MAGGGDNLLLADWPAPRGVHGLTTLRAPLGASQPPFDRLNLGARCGDGPETVERNRRLLGELAGLPEPPRWLRQVHGTTVAVEPGEDEPEADAAVTATPGRVLAILTADCLPVLFAARDGSEVGAAHAGWRGLCDGVLEATVAAMRTQAGELLAWLGPAAGPQAYEVGDEVRAAFLAVDPRAAEAFASTRPGHWHCDLYALARQRLAAIGVARVFGGEFCTISDPWRFYSFRRDGRTGRMASLVWIA